MPEKNECRGSPAPAGHPHNRSRRQGAPQLASATIHLGGKRPWLFCVYLILIMGLLLIVLGPRRGNRTPVDASPVTLSCDLAPSDVAELSELLPKTHYYFSEQYGWFDRTHFRTGDPARLIENVRETVHRGGGTVTIHQGVQEDIIGYSGTYFVSGEIVHDDLIGVALAIYRDWSVRFEAWQARPPHGLAAPTSSFSVEDLPSQYIGFFAAATHVPIEHVFACYIGPVTGQEEEPPDLVLADPEDDSDELVLVKRLQNRSFNPMVQTEDGWEVIPWPAGMALRATPSSGRTWYFLSDDTWYFREDNP